MALNPRRPLTQQSMLPGSEDEIDAPELVPAARPKKAFTRWQRR